MQLQYTYVCGELYGTHLYSLLKFLGIVLMSGEFTPIPKVPEILDFHKALLVVQDNPLPAHLSTNTCHII